MPTQRGNNFVTDTIDLEGAYTFVPDRFVLFGDMQHSNTTKHYQTQSDFDSNTLKAGVRKVAFLVGGVGVTPARCIIRDAAQRGGGPRFLVFYGNLDQDSIPFLGEFDAYEREHPEISVVHVLADPKPGWSGETGFITADIVRRHVDPHDGWHWVVAGPPAMIDAMKLVLADLEIPPEHVSLEVFAGYE